MKCFERSVSMRGGGAALLLLATGCAPAALTSGPRGGAPQPEVANVAHLPAGSPLRSSSMERGDMWLRHLVMNEKFDSLGTVLDEKSRIRPKDELQRTLQHALALHESGEYEESNRLFEWAEEEADLRYTKSATEMLTSLITNDAAMAYTPTRAEMAMIPYYRMNNYLRLGDVESATVEARKASTYLARLESGTGDACRSSTMLKHMSGLVYEIGGEADHALVALRQAEKGYEACKQVYGFGVPKHFGADLHRVARAAGIGDVATSAAKRYSVPTAKAPAGTGEVVVMLENGFVAHRSSQSVHLPIYPGDVEGFDKSNPLASLPAIALVSGRLINNLVEQGLWGAALDDRADIQVGQALEGAYIMKLSWPRYQLEANRAPALRVVVGDVVVDAPVVQDLSAEVIRDFEAVRKVVIGRAVARGLVKYGASSLAEGKATEHLGMFGGLVAGALSNAAANAVEKADTRSWSLLPDQLAMARLRLPAGEHAVKVEVLGEDGSVVAVRDAGTVTVKAGGVAMLNHRVWGPGAAEPARFAAVTQGVRYQELTGEQSAPTSYASAPAAAATAGASPAPAPTAAMAEQSGAAVPPPTPVESLPVRHSLSVTALGGMGTGMALEYQRTQLGTSLGLAASTFLYEEDTEVLAAEARVKMHFGQKAPAGFSWTVGVGGASLCDYYCLEAGEQLALTVGSQLGYSMLLGPISVGIGTGLTGAMVVGGENPYTITQYDSWGDSYDIERTDIYYLPTFSISVGFVSR